jgi:hypothetical protein
MKSETDLKSELAKAISISAAKPESGQADKIFSSLKKREMRLYEATCTVAPNLKMLLGALLTIRPAPTQNEKEYCLRLGHLSRNKDEDCRMAQLMLCVF